MDAANPVRFVASTLLFFLGEDRRRYFTHMPVVLITETGELLPPLLNGLLITLLMSHQPGDSLLPLGLLILALAASRGVIGWVRLRSKRVLGQIALNCRYRARVWGFERLVGFSMSWHHRESAGNKVQRLMTGADAVRDWGNFHNDVASPLSSMLGVAVACAFISPYFIVFAAYFVMGMVLIERFFDRRIAQLSTHINGGMESASGTLVEGATNMLTIKASGAGGMLRQAVARKEARATALGHERVALSTRKALMFHVHIGVALGIFLTVISWAALHGVIAVGFVVTYLQFFQSLRAATNAFTDRFQILVEHHADLMRLMPLFQEAQGRRGQAPFPVSWQHIRISGLHYAWGERSVLCGLDLIVARGERIGIAGESGSGKSSFIKLLLGLYEPQSGTIEIGGLRRQDISPADFEQHVAVVLQEVELFDVSLRDNITLMREQDDGWFMQVCEAAQLGGLITRLPQGVDTPLGERGLSLSGGERQRVGIARALYRRPALLILDEATSALDGATEDLVMQGILFCLSADATLIAVAHRQRSLRQMHRVVQIEQGMLKPSACANPEIV
ncbi:MAG: lipid A export ATP-binding/permease MsbA [Candidatus Dactylopiibacterium carminicum]|uniref:ABC transporter ATP-binding protein n=2 Tax=Candidatus Dactylopiibacterium carminicum TaxID=857335 RepID=A0A272ES27_9RHOO|nr:ABC transporter ATP-binding protein [Candidatus Dactylopiibacterium carminicum]PAS92846.1 MAG: lipid A export ATP-binding/permease MsbA [Candidatus Dactylopiibacterium carminicum]PAS98989.1 MAG: hypothetical protein BSR46_10535 [Candidatus Dactylopiibacterium carminicum]